MSRPPRILLPHTVVMLTSRVQQGLPFVCTPLMEMVMWSALAIAQTHYPVKIISFVIMSNHVHIIVLVEDPVLVESFMERFKCESAHAINRLLGRRQVTVWCEGYDSPTILTLEDLVEKVAYVYANPVRAHRAASISSYHGVSSWKMFVEGRCSRETKRIRRHFLAALPKGEMSSAQQQSQALWVEQQATETLTFMLSPDAWAMAFPGQASPEQFNQRVFQRLEEIEEEMTSVRKRDRISLPSEHEITGQPMDAKYAPKAFARRMWCICRNIPLRVAFIKFIKQLRAQARQVRLAWARGDLSEPFPVGLFPPCQPILATMLPAFLRKSIATKTI